MKKWFITGVTLLTIVLFFMGSGALLYCHFVEWNWQNALSGGFLGFVCFFIIGQLAVWSAI
jgi:hypothetical protein